MPVYDFKCECCGEVREYVVPLTTSIPETCECEQCDCEDKKCKLTKVESFGTSKPIFKGNGFYETDYKSKS